MLNDLVKEERMLRESYVDWLIEAAGQDDRIVLLEADLSKAATTTSFKTVYPNRIINVGVAEANMIGCAAGMSAMGKVPFTHTFTAFASRRVCDQVTLSVAYAGLNVKMMGSDPGISAELNGGTHMSMEDLAIMRNIPGMVIYEPVDSVQLKKIMPQILEHYGPVYIRLFRKNAMQVFEDSDNFILGKGFKMFDGEDVTIIASGIMVAEAFEARRLLAEEGISAEVINIHTIKPIDADLIIESASKTGAVVTAENGSIINGLGGAVCETLSENHPVPVKRVGVKDHFGEVGKVPFLQEKYGMTAKDIVSAAKAAITMK